MSGYQPKPIREVKSKNRARVGETDREMEATRSGRGAVFGGRERGWQAHGSGGYPLRRLRRRMRDDGPLGPPPRWLPNQNRIV